MAFAISMVVFRSETVADAVSYLWRWFDSPATWTSISPRFRNQTLLSSPFLMFAVDWVQRSGLEIVINWRHFQFIPAPVITGLHWSAMLCVLVWVGTQFYSDAAFIYFQF